MADAMPESLQEYAAQHSAQEPPLLKKINRETYVQVSQPHMLSGHLQGRFLSLVSKLLCPKRILEIGTFTGYSALCLAEGLQSGGELHTLDINDELADRCRAYFKEAGLGDRIKLHTGDATTLLPTIPGPFDLVFIDADKLNYSTYYDLVIDKLRPGGVILADNVLYHGEVLNLDSEQSHNARAISAFNKKIAADERVETVLLTLRDGLFLIRKK
jgi:predicted O-methyltransferase YrrM